MQRVLDQNRDKYDKYILDVEDRYKKGAITF